MARNPTVWFSSRSRAWFHGSLRDVEMIQLLVVAGTGATLAV